MNTVAVTLKTWFDKVLDVPNWWVHVQDGKVESGTKDLDHSFEEEVDPTVDTAENYVKAMIQEQVMSERQTYVSDSEKSYRILAMAVERILKKNKVTVRKMVGWRQVNFMEFMKSVREIFEVREGSTPKYSWTRVAAMFAYAVVLAEREQESPYRLKKILDWFSISFKFYASDFVRDCGGWEDLAREYNYNFKPQGGSVFMMAFNTCASILTSALAFLKLRFHV